MSGNELFYIDEDGDKQDESLHEDILNDLSDSAAQEIQVLAVKRGMSLGMTEQQARELYL
ncbi:MAG: hypothetical protein GQ570_03830 [Helicobacteraceae bacterium]|nr:hypothetical protein [Helicobacteraceae bacterium]